MPVERATLEDAVVGGIDLNKNAFLLIHGWTAAPLLLEFAAKPLESLLAGPQTPQQLAAQTGAKEGPLAIMLRTCSALGFLDFDSAAGTYRVAPGPELEALQRTLGPSSAASAAFRRIYSEASPPFKVPSPAASLCLQVWREHRQSWKGSGSKALSVLLDGVVLSPLLTSITYFARWNEEGLDSGKEHALDKFDFSAFPEEEREALRLIFEELGASATYSNGTLTVPTKGSLALQRVYSYYVPTSYSPLLSRFKQVLFEDPAWGFAGESYDPEQAEIHLERTLNVVGSGAQHQTLFKDMMSHLNAVFAGEDYEKQPKFVVDTGCGDGHLLMHIYEHVKKHTPRGQVLDEHPLTMVGVDFNEAARVATAVNLSQHEIPHKVLAGDIGKPSAIMVNLKKKKVDPTKSLHVRSFLDHDRPYIAPEKTLVDGTAVATFARAQMADFVHLDKEGAPISPLDLFASLVEHMKRWGDAIEGSFGLCLLEVMMLDVPTTKRFMNDCVSFHFDIVQCLSRQYMVSSTAFAMGAAMAGLLPTDIRSVRTYPEQGNYCRMLNQHLVRRPFTIRFAEISDLPSLEKLEELAWDENLRAPSATLRKRLETSPATNLVCELKGEVVAVLYMQRIPDLGTVDRQKFMEISDTHTPDGRVLQLIAISANPEISGLGIGSELRSFALHLARIDPTVDSVIGVTRCKEFKKAESSLQDYVDQHVAGKISDRTLHFHTGNGAKVLRLVPGFRPEDVNNDGVGVLIQYKVKEWIPKTVSAGKGKAKPAEDVKPVANVSTVELLCGIMEDLGYPVDEENRSTGFFAFGIDSLEMVRIRSRLGGVLGRELPATLLLDFPSVQELGEQLDKERGFGENGAKQDAPNGPEVGWDTLKLEDLTALQEKLLKLYALPQNQRKLEEQATKHLPDMAKYMSAIEPVLLEVEGPVLFSFGLVEDMKPASVAKGREGFVKCIRRLARQSPDVLTRDKELKALLKCT